MNFLTLHFLIGTAVLYHITKMLIFNNFIKENLYLKVFRYIANKKTKTDH